MIAPLWGADYSVELEAAPVSVSVDLTLCRNLSGLARCDETSTNAANQHLLAPLFSRRLQEHLFIIFLSKSPHNSYNF